MNIQKRKLNNINPKKGKKNNKLQIIGQNLQNEINGLLNEFEAKEKEDHLLLNQKINPNSKNDLPIIIIPKPSSGKLLSQYLMLATDGQKTLPYLHYVLSTA